MWEQFSSGWFREKLYLITCLAVYQNHVVICKLSSVKTLCIRRARFHLLRDSLKSAVSEWLHRIDILPRSIDVFKQTGCQPIERWPSTRAGFFKRHQIYRRGNLQWYFTQSWHSKNNICTRIFADFTNQHKFTKKQEVALEENSVSDTARLNCSGLFHSVP